MENNEKLPFNEKLKNLRMENGLTQENLAKQLVVTRQTVSKWEIGINQPDIDTLSKLSQLFGVSVDELIGCGTPKKTKNTAKTLFAASALVALFCCLATFVLARFLQSTLPMHYNQNFEVDRYGSNWETLLHLSVFAVFFGVNAALFFQYRKNSGKVVAICSIVTICVCVAYLVFIWILHGKYLLKDTTLNTVSSFVGCLMFCLAIGVHPKVNCSRNMIFGVRTGLTLSDDKAWSDLNAVFAYVLGVTAVVFTTMNMIVLPKLVSFLSFGLFAIDEVIIAVYHAHYQKRLRSQSAD